MSARSDFTYFHTVRVRWSEVDPQGIVFNPNYFVYVDLALTEYFRMLGYGGSAFEQDGIEFFTVNANCDYRSPARFDEEIEIGFRAARFGNSSMTYAFAMFRGDTLDSTNMAGIRRSATNAARSRTSAVPASVAVEMEYDADVRLPADAKAAIVTPTLVADRYVQLTPAYSGGEVLADGADIALPDTGVPVELDRIYRSLRDLSQALGPNGVNRDGTLDNLLRAGDEALSGQGERGNRMIRELSAAATTFGEGSGDLFDTVTELATFTGTLAENDRLVRAFLRDLAGVAADLADERQESSAALAAVARAVGSVEDFVGDNREALVTDVEKLTRVVKNLDSERDSLDTALTVAPVAMGNLALAFNNESNSIGSRIGIGGNVWDADGFLCGIVQQAGLPRVSADLACELFEMLLEPITTQVPFIPPEHSRRPSGTIEIPRLTMSGGDIPEITAPPRSRGSRTGESRDGATVYVKTVR